MLRYVFLVLLFFGLTGTALAQTPPKPATGTPRAAPLGVGGQIKADPAEIAQQQLQNAPDFKSIPVIQNMLRSGAEFYYLGERSGLHGFLVYKEKQVQIFYLTPDHQAVIFGGMFSGDGANITTQQIGFASDTNAQLKALLMAATEQQREIDMKTAGSSAIPSLDKDGLPPGTPLSPGERLYNDFQAAAGVVLGEAGKPLLMMLADPLCPHCRDTWNALKDPVAKGLLRVKILPVGPQDSDRERMAATFLRVAEPLQVWNKFEAGDHALLAGEPKPADLASVRATMTMAANWKISSTPYLVYRGKDGKVKIVQGSPEKITTVLTDLSP